MAAILAWIVAAAELAQIGEYLRVREVLLLILADLKLFLEDHLALVGEGSTSAPAVSIIKCLVQETLLQSHPLLLKLTGTDARAAANLASLADIEPEPVVILPLLRQEPWRS